MLCAGDTRSGGSQNLHDACQVNALDAPNILGPLLCPGKRFLSRGGRVRAPVEGVTLGFKSGAPKTKMVKAKASQT